MSRAHTVSESRAIPVGIEAAYRGAIEIPLEVMFKRRSGPIAPVASTTPDDPAVTWGSRVGQTRIVSQQGPGTQKETLVSTDEPNSFAYLLDEITGPLAPLVDHIDGRFDFAPEGTGTKVTWTWVLHTKSRVADLAFPGFAVAWHGFARKGLEELSHVLVRAA